MSYKGDSGAKAEPDGGSMAADRQRFGLSQRWARDMGQRRMLRMGPLYASETTTVMGGFGCCSTTVAMVLSRKETTLVGTRVVLKRAYQ
jgi:hypothetical protein